MKAFILAMCLAVMVALVPGAAFAADLVFPPLSGRVVDQAHLLDAAQSVDLTSKLAALEARSGRQLVVATIPSLQGDTIEDYGYRLGRSWAIGGSGKAGQQGKDDGVILIVAPTEHQVRIEAGYGGRVFVTDAMSSVIIRDAIVPRFKAGDVGGGIIAGVDQIITLMNLSPEEAAKRNAAVGASEAARQRSGGGRQVPWVGIAFMLIFFIWPMFRAIGGRRFRGRGGSPVVIWGPGFGGGLGGGGGFGGGGGGFGGGGGGFGGGGGGFSGGGGSFGGGGASGSW